MNIETFRDERESFGFEIWKAYKQLTGQERINIEQNKRLVDMIKEAFGQSPDLVIEAIEKLKSLAFEHDTLNNIVRNKFTVAGKELITNK